MQKGAVFIFTIFIILPLQLRALTQAEIEENNWKAFLIAYKKSYPDPTVYAFRKTIFTENYYRVNTCNEQYKTGQIQFGCNITYRSDWTKAEIKALSQGYINGFAKAPGTPIYDYTPPPPRVNWKETGAIKPPVNQELCSSAWAVAAVRVIESHCFIKTGKNISLSVQELVDCSQEFDNAGCDGGRMDAAFRYIKKYGLSTAENYPNSPLAGTCRRSSAPRSSVVLESYVNNPEGNELSLMKYIADKGPAVVAIDANYWTYYHYRTGIFSEPDCSSYDLNSALELYGYGEENGTAYWLCQAPLGKGWGENGSIKLKRNKSNHCGIATDASIPIVSSC